MNKSELKDSNNLQRVNHPKYGNGVIVTFYEFYNHTFVDILFDGQDEPKYMQYVSINQNSNESSNHINIL